MLNIMVPLSDRDAIGILCEAGADEFYCGFRDSCWHRRFGDFEEINRMSSFGSKANFDISEIPAIVNSVKQYGKKIYITFNSAMYSLEEKEYLRTVLPRIGPIDGVILSDPALIEIANQYDIPVTLSTMGGCYNSAVVRFFYKLGIRRIILPRDITIKNMESIIKDFPDIAFEVFIMRNGCKYSDSQCMSYHARKHGSMCACFDNLPSELIFSADCSNSFRREGYANHQLFTKAFHKKACGFCAVMRFESIGINSLKIVGRADSLQEIINDVVSVKSILEGKKDKNSMPYYDNCLYGLNCYYKV